MFFPVAWYMKNYTVINRKRQTQILSVISTFTLMLFLAHILACYLIIIGTDPDPNEDSQLWLANNHIGDAGVSALASACASGALDHIKDLYLNNNPISKQAQDTMRAAAAARGVSLDF